MVDAPSKEKEVNKKGSRRDVTTTKRTTKHLTKRHLPCYVRNQKSRSPLNHGRKTWPPPATMLTLGSRRKKRKGNGRGRRGPREKRRKLRVLGPLSPRRSVHQLSLLVQPALGRVVPPLKDDVVALKPAGEVVPCRGDHCVFALEVLDDLVVGGLFLISVLVSEMQV